MMRQIEFDEKNKSDEYYIKRLKEHDKFAGSFGIDEVRINQWLLMDLILDLRREVNKLSSKNKKVRVGK